MDLDGSDHRPRRDSLSSGVLVQALQELSTMLSTLDMEDARLVLNTAISLSHQPV